MPKADNRFTLPDVIDPPNRICVTLYVPDDPIHFSNFWGALDELAQGNSWADDQAHTAKKVIQVWRDVLNKVTVDKCSIAPIAGISEDFAMPLRVDCNCNVFVTCCDGTEKQILTSDQVQALINGPAVPGAKQPAPGGGCQDYKILTNGHQLQLIPTIVSSGDVITLVSAKGATNLPSSVTWLCADGLIYFAGACGGVPSSDPGNDLPSANTGTVIIYLNGTYYAFLAGSFTVPPGISKIAPMLLINQQHGSDINGQVEIDVQVCNNAPATWSHTIDLRTTSANFIEVVPDNCDSGGLGVWSPSVGFVQTSCENAGGHNQGLDMRYEWVMPSTITSVDFESTNHFGTLADGGGGIESLYEDAALASHVIQLDVTLTNGVNHSGGSGPWTARALRLRIICDSQTDPNPVAGTANWYKLTVTGSGFDPFSSL